MERRNGMKLQKVMPAVLAVNGAALLAATPAMADNMLEDLLEHVGILREDQSIGGGEERITGVPGSPSATTSIDGKQLPPPPQKFGGVIKETAKDSKPWWSPKVVPPKGA